MGYRTIVVAYDQAGRASNAILALRRLGVPASDIKRHPVDAAGPEDVAAALPAGHAGGLWSWLFGDDAADQQVQLYRQALQRGGTIISVQVMEEEEASVRACLDACGPLDLREMPEPP